MRRSLLMTAWVFAWPSAAAETPAQMPEPEFLEFLGEMTDEDEEFIRYMESRKGERDLKRAEKETSKEDDDE